MGIEIFHGIFFVVLGGLAGLIERQVARSFSFVVLPSVLIFSEWLAYPPEWILVFAIATSITAYVPILIFSYVKASQRIALSFESHTKLSYFAVIAALVSAQLIGIVSISVTFGLFLVSIGLYIVCSVPFIQSYFTAISVHKYPRILLGILVGVSKTQSGFSSQVILRQAFGAAGNPSDLRLVHILVSLAATIGFLFPAIPLAEKVGYEMSYAYLIGYVDYVAVLAIFMGFMVVSLITTNLRVSHFERQLIRYALYAYAIASLIR